MIGGAFYAAPGGAAALVFTNRKQRRGRLDLKAIQAEIDKQHEEAIHRLQRSIRQPSIAAENRGMNEGCEHMMRLLRDVDTVAKVPTDGQPGLRHTRCRGRRKRSASISCTTSSKPTRPSGHRRRLKARSSITRIGKVLIGRGATNWKGPEAPGSRSHAFKAAGRKLPVNLVFVAEGEEEIGSPHFPQVVRRGSTFLWPSVSALAFTCPCRCKRSTARLPSTRCERRSSSSWFPAPPTGIADPRKISTRATKRESIAPPGTWFRHWRLWVGPDGHTPAIEGFAEKATRPLTAEEKALIREASKRQNEDMVKRQLGIEHWVHNVDFLESSNYWLGGRR